MDQRLGRRSRRPPGHRYVLTTYVYSMEVYRSGETYHSSVHPAGSGLGGAAVAADVRFVLELQDIDPSNPATLVAPATVLFDGVITNAPGFCTYALVNATNMQCSIAYTYADSHFAGGSADGAAEFKLCDTVGGIAFRMERSVRSRVRRRWIFIRSMCRR